MLNPIKVNIGISTFASRSKPPTISKPVEIPAGLWNLNKTIKCTGIVLCNQVIPCGV